MNTLVVNNRSSSLEHLEKLINDLKLQPKVVQVDQLADVEINPEDLVILSGSHELTAAWNDYVFAQEMQLIKSHVGPLVGICLGMQLIAHTYGSSIHQLPKKRYGIAPIKFIDKPSPQSAEVFESHSWSVKKLSEPLVVVAESGAGIEILRHNSRPQYGLQFHPEAANDIDGKIILKNILSEILPN